MKVKKIIKKEYKVVVSDVFEEGNFDLKNTVDVYTQDDKYVGTLKELENLFNMGIYDIQAYGNNSCCSIGFNDKEQKWYGWSHRAMFGFGIGHVVKACNCEADRGLSEEYLKEHPEDDLSVPVGFVCKTLDDCKRCAIAFSAAVS